MYKPKLREKPMYTILIITILGFLGFFVVVRKTYDWENDKKYLFVPILVLAFVGFVITAFLTTILSSSYREYEFSHTNKIISLSINDSQEGRFLLGYGTINNTEYYFMFQRVGEDTYTRTRLPVTLCAIKEVDTQPRMVVLERKYQGVAKYFLLSMGNGLYDQYFTLEVPKGTIIREFEVR